MFDVQTYTNQLIEELKEFLVNDAVETPKVSVVVPCYNVEEYLEECLVSLIKQTFKDTEIICVNDGATDSTPQILDAFAQIDKRIKVLTQENKGLSGARNTGIKYANGEFIIFVDSDDWVDENYIEKLYFAILNNNADISACTIIRWRKNHQKYRVHYTEEKTYETLKEKIEACSIPKCCYVWNKMYKSELVKSNLFNEGVYYEDMLWTPNVLKQSEKLVTVPGTNYYYRANKNSIVKKKPSLKKQCDSYNSHKFIVKFFEENNLFLSEKEKNITKHLTYFWKIPVLKVKEYNNIDTTILFGFLPISKTPSNKTFLVFNTACLGDVLVCNSLVQNIKLLYPDSKVVFVCDKKFYDAAKYQKDVDEVLIYDKSCVHKGLAGLYKFIKDCPYKKPFASFITYSNLRNCIIAKMLGSKFIIHEKSALKFTMATQERHANLLKEIAKQDVKNLSIEYNASDDIPNHLQTILNKNENYIGLCVLTKNPPKNIPIETAKNIIKYVNSERKYKIILFGVGKENEDYAEQLKKAGCDFIDLVNKTSIYELAQVLKNCKCLISADTGTMHLGYAVKTPVVAVFNEKLTLKSWTPNPDLYKSVVISSNQTAENIMAGCKYLLNEKRKLSVVIPTLQKNKPMLVRLLEDLEQDDSVDEIILIDNSLKGIENIGQKLNVIIPDSNMFVNPSWNLGVEKAKNDVVALLNDDITIPEKFCARVLEQLTPNMGCVGFNIDNICVTHDIKPAPDTTDLKLNYTEYRGNHWGIAIFFYKSSYIRIPNELKIFCGDDWIFLQSKIFNRKNYQISGQNIYHYGSLSSDAKSLSSIGDRDRRLYRKYTRKWWNYLFNIEPVFRGIRITVFGIEVLCHYDKKH